MMQQKMPWEEDWTQPQSAPTGVGNYPTITIPRDPRQVAREDAAAVRAAEADRRARENDERDRIRFGERSKPTLPAGYMMGPDGRTAVRIPGLPPEKDASPPASTADLASVRAEALDKIRLARSLQQRSKDGWFTTGFGAGVAGMVGGSPAYDVRQDTETLKNAGALTRIMEMAKTNGGKNPLTPLSNSDFQALASSLSNLETGQSDGQYQANVQRVIDLYTRAYQGAGGADLEGDLDPTKRRREPSVVGVAQAPSTPVIAGGATKSERDPERERALDGLIRSGADMATLNAKSREMGGSNLDTGQVDQWRAFYAKHPDYRGSSVDTSVSVPTTAWNRFTASPLGTGIYAAADAGLGGTSDELAALLGGGDLAEINARKQAAFSANPKSALLGQVVGAVGATAGVNRLLPGTTSALRALGIDTVYGGLSGAGQTNDNRTLGALVGTAGAAAGNVVGQGVAGVVGAGLRTQPGTALLNSGRGMFFGRDPIARAPQPSAADAAALGALRRAGPEQVTTQLQEAQRLGLPMSLADTGAGPRELLGAAVRRSPEAGGVVEDALIARNRGQYDRFSAAVNRDLGPTTSIPQRSADLTAQARAAASPLYDRAYANPVPVTPELDAVLGTPFGRQALGRARTIAANERRSPTELGFGMDDSGNTILNSQSNDLIARHLDARAALDEAQDAYRAARQTVGANTDTARDRLLMAREIERRAREALFSAPDPTMAASMPTYTTQSLDYVKRGMDDVLEEQRNPITGRLQLDEAGRAQNQVRGQLLSEVDRLNPDFAAARQAYAGPVASRDAMIRGVDAYSLPPDELAMQVGNQTPEHLGQMQLGYRSELMNHAGRVRDASNPWEATLGSPAARSRMALLHGDTLGTSNLLRTRDLEAQMQRTSNAVIGNSRTAQRQIADDAFGAGGAGRMAESALHAGAAVATNGASLPGTAARMLGMGLRDRAMLGFGRAAERKAEALAPLLGNVDPATGLATLEDLIARDAAYQAFRRATTPRRMFGRLGAAGSGQAAVIPVR